METLSLVYGDLKCSFVAFYMNWDNRNEIMHTPLFFHYTETCICLNEMHITMKSSSIFEIDSEIEMESVNIRIKSTKACILYTFDCKLVLKC